MGAHMPGGNHNTILMISGDQARGEISHSPREWWHLTREVIARKTAATNGIYGHGDVCNGYQIVCHGPPTKTALIASGPTSCRILGVTDTPPDFNSLSSLALLQLLADSLGFDLVEKNVRKIKTV